MISFSHNPKKTRSQHHLQFEEQAQPYTITNAGSGKQFPMPQPNISKKKIIKTHSNNKLNNERELYDRASREQKSLQNQPWNNGGIATKVGLFDYKLRKDTLAAQERQIRAQSRRKQNPRQRQREQERQKKILTKQQQIQRKKIEMIEAQREKEIERLRKLVQKQRKEQQQNRIKYEIQKQKIQAQRKKFIQIQRKIQKQGPKAIKELKQQIFQPYPSQDKVKLKEELNQQNPKKQNTRSPNYNNFTELTQSQSIANQKNKIRQQQLQYLIDQREKNYKQYQTNTLGYTPTLIPLLSRASYKIISTHISSLVELFIDDLLEQQVYVLQSIQLQSRALIQKEKQKQILNDYIMRLDNFVDEVENIQSKTGTYSGMKFNEVYKNNKNSQQPIRRHPFTYFPEQVVKLESRLEEDDIEEINHRIERFKRYVGSFDEYKTGNLQMFKSCTQEMIQQAILKIAQELENGAGEFVNIIFRNQFN